MSKTKRALTMAAAGLTLTGVAAGLPASPASAGSGSGVFQEWEAQEFYYSVGLGPDWSGVNYWKNRIDSAAGGPVEASCAANGTWRGHRGAMSNVYKDFLWAAGKINLGSTYQKKQTVRAIYQLVLRRNADSGGLNFYVNQLNNGMSWQTVVNNLVYSGEYANHVPQAGKFHRGYECN